MDIATLASADFFVGTFSSNVGMLVYQLRAASMEPETLNRLTVSLDDPWGFREKVFCLGDHKDE